MRVGIIGQGFVGSAVREVFSRAMEVYTFDIKTPDRILAAGPYRKWECSIPRPVFYLRDAYQELLRLTDGPIFLCLPTPMNPDGSVALFTLEQAVRELSSLLDGQPIRHLVIKSTVPPGTCDRFHEQYDNVNIVFCPEFLREVSPVQDFERQLHVILGGIALGEVTQVFKMALPHAVVVPVSRSVAEMTKYVVNCFLAVKVSLANELRQICAAADISNTTTNIFSKSFLSSNISKES